MTLEEVKLALANYLRQQHGADFPAAVSTNSVVLRVGDEHQSPAVLRSGLVAEIRYAAHRPTLPRRSHAR